MPDLQKFHVKYFGNFEAKAVDHMYLKDICSALEFVDLVIYGYDQYHTNFTKTQIRRWNLLPNKTVPDNSWSYSSPCNRFFSVRSKFPYKASFIAE